MPSFNVIQQTFPDGSHRWKFFSFAMRQGDILLDPLPSSSPPVHEPGWTIERKEKENAKRAKQVVYELARSNADKWDWFVTLTFDPNLVRRDDYVDCLRHVRSFTKDLTRLGCYWLFVPEHHKDGYSFHFHGLVGGDFPMVEAGYHGLRGKERLTWNLLDFPGHTTVQRVMDATRVSTYITKYITKDLVHVVPKGCHRYLHSRNLLRPEVDYYAMTPFEFSCLVHYGLVPDTDDLETNLSDMRFVKLVPMYYQLSDNFMYIVED